MNVQSIVNTAMTTGILTTEMNRWLVLMVQHSPCTPDDMEAANQLIEALIEGSVISEPDPSELDESLPRSA